MAWYDEYIDDTRDGGYYLMKTPHVFADEDLTTPASVGNTIGAVKDIAYHGNHLTQPDSALRPTLTTDPDGFTYSKGDGVEDYLVHNFSGGEAPLMAGFIALISERPTVAGSAATIAGIGEGANYVQMRIVNSSRLDVRSRGQGGSVSQQTVIGITSTARAKSYVGYEDGSVIEGGYDTNSKSGSATTPTIQATKFRLHGSTNLGMVGHGIHAALWLNYNPTPTERNDILEQMLTDVESTVSSSSIKVFTGSEFEAKPLKVWNGSSWVDLEMNVIE